MTLDIGRAVTFAFEDREWPKKLAFYFYWGLFPV